MQSLVDPIRPGHDEIGVDIGSILPVVRQSRNPYIYKIFFMPKLARRPELDVAGILVARNLVMAIPEDKLHSIEYSPTILHVLLKRMIMFISIIISRRICYNTNNIQWLRYWSYMVLALGGMNILPRGVMSLWRRIEHSQPSWVPLISYKYTSYIYMRKCSYQNTITIRFKFIQSNIESL